MVFGWGKKKIVQHDEEVEPVFVKNSEISLLEIPKILNDIKTLRQKTLVSEIKFLRKKILTDRKNLLSIVSELKNDNLNTDDIDNHLKILVNRGKSEVISTIKKEFQSSFLEINSIENVLEFEKVASKSIKKVGDILGKHSRVIHIFAKKYAKKLKDDLHVLDDLLKEIKNVISNYKSNQEFLSIINQNIEKISSIRDIVFTQKKRECELNDLLEEESSKMSMLLKNEADIMSSSDYKSYIDIKSKLDILVGTEKKLQYDLDEYFVKISRPLNKYVHISSLEKPLKILNEKLIVSPYEVLNEQNNSDIITILNSVQSAITSGAISVKDTEKSIEQIRLVKQILPRLINQKTDFYKNKSIQQENLEKFDYDSFLRCKNGIKKSNDETASLKSKQIMLKKHIHENEDLISETFSTLEVNLKSASSVSYKIISD